MKQDSIEKTFIVQTKILRELVSVGQDAVRSIAGLIPFDNPEADEQARKIIEKIGDDAAEVIRQLQRAIDVADLYLQDQRRLKMQWTIDPPSEEGWYAFKRYHEWPIRTAQVRLGDWRQAQDPGSFYAGSEPVQEMKALWLRLPGINVTISERRQQ